MANTLASARLDPEPKTHLTGGFREALNHPSAIAWPGIWLRSAGTEKLAGGWPGSARARSIAFAAVLLRLVNLRHLRSHLPAPPWRTDHLTMRLALSCSTRKPIPRTRTPYSCKIRYAETLRAALQQRPSWQYITLESLRQALRLQSRRRCVHISSRAVHRRRLV